MTETRLGVVILAGSLFALLLLDPVECKGNPDPLWLYGFFTFTLSFAFVWLAITVLSLLVTRTVAVLFGLCAYFSISLIGWGVSSLLAINTADGELLTQGIIWIPFWILGVLVGADVLSVCGD